jgi:hypothetical protein
MHVTRSVVVTRIILSLAMIVALQCFRMYKPRSAEEIRQLPTDLDPLPERLSIMFQFQNYRHSIEYRDLEWDIEQYPDVIELKILKECVDVIDNFVEDNILRFNE